MRYFFWLLLAAAVAWLAYEWFAPIRGVRNVGPSRFARELADAGPAGRLLIDVREPHEFARGHIRGAVNIPLSELAPRIGEISTDRRIFVYCQSGMRSRRAARMLSKRGCRDIVHLNGGLAGWRGETVN